MTKFIVDHRYECDEHGNDPCGEENHPAIVIGQMADNKMDIIRDQYIRQQHEILEDKYDWFADNITKDKEGRRLDAMELGNQIAFCDDKLNDLLKLDSYFTFDTNKKEWERHGTNNPV